MHIKSCKYAIDKDNLSRYKDPHKFKVYKNTVLNDHLHNVNDSISRIQDKSSKVIENIINENYGSRYISNISATS